MRPAIYLQPPNRSLIVLSHSLASKIREVYTFIAQNYVAGDLICLFGYYLLLLLGLRITDLIIQDFPGRR